MVGTFENNWNMMEHQWNINNHGPLRIHGTNGIFTYMYSYHKNSALHVGTYTYAWDPMDEVHFLVTFIVHDFFLFVCFFANQKHED